MCFYLESFGCRCRYFILSGDMKWTRYCAAASPRNKHRPGWAFDKFTNSDIFAVFAANLSDISSLHSPNLRPVSCWQQRPGFLSQFSYHCHCNYSDESRSRQPTLDNSSREEIVQMFHLASGAVLRYFWCCHSTEIDKEVLKAQEMWNWQCKSETIPKKLQVFFISQVITPPSKQSLEWQTVVAF